MVLGPVVEEVVGRQIHLYVSANARLYHQLENAVGRVVDAVDSLGNIVVIDKLIVVHA